MNLFNPGVDRVIISSPTNSTSVTILGRDMSPSSTLEKEVLTRGISSAGNATYLNERWSFSIDFADPSAFSSLQALSKEKTYRLTVLKLNGFVFWDQEFEFSLDESTVVDPESEDYPYTIRSSNVYSNPSIIRKVNAVAPLEDSDSDNLADGFTFSGVITSSSFTAGVQEVTTSDTVRMYKDIYLPAEGLSFFYTVETLTAGVGRVIEYLDETKTELSNNNTVYGGTGVQNFTATIPTGAYYVRVGVTFGNGVSSETDSIQNLSFKTSDSEFVNY